MKHFIKTAAVLCLISMNKSFAMDEKTAHEVWEYILKPKYSASWNHLNSLLYDYKQYGLTATEGTKSDSDLKKMYQQFLNDWASKGWGESKWVTINKNHLVEIFSNGLHKHFLTLPGFTEGTHRILEILQYENHIPYALQQYSIIDEEKSAAAASPSPSSSNSVSATTTIPASTSSVSKKTTSGTQRPAIRIEADSISEAMGILINFFNPTTTRNFGQTSTQKSSSATSSSSSSPASDATASATTSAQTTTAIASASNSSTEEEMEPGASVPTIQTTACSCITSKSE